MKTLVYLFVLAFIISCSNGPLNKSYDFDNNRWASADVKEFDFEVSETTSFKALVLSISHVYQPGYESIPVLVTITGPEGKEDVPLELSLKDSECAGDICDMNYDVKKGLTLPKGSYKITVQHKFTGAAFLPNIISIKMDLE